MAYREDEYKYGPFIEHEIKFAGQCGAKGEKRAKRKKATPEQVKKQNQYNREKKILRKIRCNFKPGDLWLTMKFPKGTRMPVKEIKGVRKSFFDTVRKKYKKRGQVLKFVYRIEVGERGGIHFHVLMNRLDGTPGTAEIVSEVWNKLTDGHVNYEPVYEKDYFKELANYIVKEPTEEITGQLTLFGKEEETKIFIKYDCSRNLEMPEKKTHKYKRRTVRKLIENGPKPQPGYYIDRDSIRHGKNPYTGMSYYYYTEIRLERDAGEIRRECEDLCGQSVYTPLRP